MSNIDRAFIKAFGSRGPAGVRGPHVPLKPPAETPAAAVEASAAPATLPLASAAPAPAVSAPAPLAVKVVRPSAARDTLLHNPTPRLAPETVSDLPAAPVEPAPVAPVVQLPAAPVPAAAVTPLPVPEALPPEPPATIPLPAAAPIAQSHAERPKITAAPRAPGATPPELDAKTPLIPKTQLECFGWKSTELAIEAAIGAELTGLADQLIVRAEAGAKLLLVSSWARGEGRTSLLVCLGRKLAQLGQRVAMVDGDFARPALAARLGLSPQHGWTETLTGDLSLADVAIESTSEGLVALPLRETQAGSIARFPSGPRLRLILGLLRRDYDLVLIDGGPLREGNDPPAGWPQIDAALLVHNPAVTSAADLELAQRQLHVAGIEVLGIAENFV